MQTKETLQQFIDQFEYNDWKFLLRFNKDVPYLQIKFMAVCNMHGGEPHEQSCRKWMLSYYMTNDEVVSTAFKAVMAAVEHETREQFKWKGEPIYRPHVDPQALWEISHANRVQKRPEPDRYDHSGHDIMGVAHDRSSWEGEVDRQGGSFTQQEIIDSLQNERW